MKTIALATIIALGGCAAPNVPRGPIGRAATPKHLAPKTEARVVTRATNPHVTRDSENRDSGQDSIRLASHAEQPGIEQEVATPSNSQASLSLSLEQIEQLALEHNPTIGQAFSSAEKAAALRNQVGRPPNPVVGYFGSQIADAGTDQHGVFVEQELARGGKLQLNQSVFRQAERAQLAVVDSQRYRVLTDVRIRFFAALAEQQEIQLTSEFMELCRKAVEIARLRKDALEGSQLEFLQTEIQLKEIELAREQAEYAFRGAIRELLALAGIPDTNVQGLTGELKTGVAGVDWDQAFDRLVMTSPELQEANARVDQACANLRRQTSQAMPNPRVQIGAGVDNATNSGLINVQVASAIPVSNANLGNIAAARADYRRALDEVTRIELDIRNRLAQVGQELDSARAAVEKYEQEILPRAQETLTVAEFAYERGELEFLQVFLIRRVYFESNVKYVKSLATLAQARARLDGFLLEGGLESPGDFTENDGLRAQAFDQQ